MDEIKGVPDTVVFFLNYICINIRLILLSPYLTVYKYSSSFYKTRFSLSPDINLPRFAKY